MKPRSLKARALQLLAQRDQSRLELRRKLLTHARRTEAGGEDDDGAPVAEVDALLDWLVARRFLCDERFVESRVHAREARFGNLRIQAELARHAVALTPEMQRTLAESEIERARAVRARRFAEPPSGAAERAAQARFLAGRGFSPDVVRSLFRQLRPSSH